MKNHPPGEDLFKLIHSLNTTETGYFVSSVNRSRVKNAGFYIRLFKLIKKQETYNETELKTGLKDLGLLKNFAFHKTRLTELVLHSVVAFKSSASADSQLHQLLESIKFLYQKQLTTHALKLVDKARQLGKKYEKLFALLELNNHERQILKNRAMEKVYELLEENYRERNELLEKLENDSRLSYINDKVYAIFRELYQMKKTVTAKELEQLMQEPLLSNENKALTFNAKLKYNTTHACYYNLLRKDEELFSYRKRIVELWDQYPHMKTEYPLRYHSDLTNLISQCLVQNKEPDFKNELKRLESVSGGKTENDAFLFGHIYMFRQVYLLNNRQFKQALELIPKIEQGMKKFGNTITQSQQLTLRYNIASTYFLNENYSEALHSFELISNTNRNHRVRTDLRDLSGIFRIVLLYQTGKHDLAEYEVRNTRDRLKNNNKLFELEQVVIKYIPLLIAKETAAKEKAEIINNFLQTLETMFARPENKMLLGLEELIVWLKKKM